MQSFSNCLIFVDDVGEPLDICEGCWAKNVHHLDPGCTNIFFSFSFSDKNLPPGFPTILKNPSMKVVEKGRNAILECEAAGEPQVRKSTEYNRHLNSRYI